MPLRTAAAVAIGNYSMNWPAEAAFDYNDDEVDRNDTKCTASGSPRYFIIIFGQQKIMNSNNNSSSEQITPPLPVQSERNFFRGPDARFVSEPPFIAAPPKKKLIFFLKKEMLL
jgi:hypothetical protein